MNEKLNILGLDVEVDAANNTIKINGTLYAREVFALLGQSGLPVGRSVRIARRDPDGAIWLSDAPPRAPDVALMVSERFDEIAAEKGDHDVRGIYEDFARGARAVALALVNGGVFEAAMVLDPDDLSLDDDDE